MQIKGIIFDKDGTLIRFNELWLPAAKYAAAEVISAYGAEEQLMWSLLDAIGAQSGADGLLCCGTYRQISDAFGAVLKNAGMTADSEELYRLTCEAFGRGTEKGQIVPACGDIQGLMQRLRNKGHKLFAATTDGESVTRKCLETLGIYGMFDEVYTDNGVIPPKPDPYCINEIIRRFDIDRSDLVMVGDTMTDIEFAKNGGIRAVAVAEDGALMLRAGAAAVIRDISQLEEVLDEI